MTDYLAKADLTKDLDALGFNLVGYGCTTCIGNSGPLQPEIAKAIEAGDLVSCSVLSGNRNFEGRIGPDIKANYLASPPLVVAYAIAGSLKINITTDPKERKVPQKFADQLGIEMHAVDVREGKLNIVDPNTLTLDKDNVS